MWFVHFDNTYSRGGRLVSQKDTYGIGAAVLKIYEG